MASISSLVFIDEAGFHYPDYPTVLASLQDDYRTIYGNDVYLEPDSQDGQWIAIVASAIHDTLAVAAASYNSFSPMTALSDALSRNVKINGIRRRVPTRSTVDVLVVGQVGTQITDGIVEDILGQRWSLPASVVIPLAGQITVTATAVDLGAISAAPNTVSKISTPTRGWQTVNNAASAAEGEPVETDAELRIRQSQSTSLPSLSVLEGIKGAIANLPGVTRVEGYENDTGATDSDGIPAHSISFVVEGGDAQQIGDTIALKKTPGTRTYGTTSVMTFDKYGVPNEINFFRPTSVPITIAIGITPLAGYTSGFEALIKQANVDFVNALRIGADVFYTRLFVPASLAGTASGATFVVDSIEISRDGDPVSAANVVIAFNEAAECSLANVTVNT
jgi:uncharacterized phage protein gp47/JayE